MFDKIRFIFLLVVIALLMLSSCSSLSEDRMMPDFGVMQYKSSQKVLKVKVLEGVFHDGDAGFQQKDLDAEMLEKSLLMATDGSGIFKDVVLSEQSDYELTGKKEKQKWRGQPDGTIRVLLSINYALMDSKTNEPLWQEVVHTLGMCTIKEYYNGYSRSNTALERALKKNLEKFIMAILVNFYGSSSDSDIVLFPKEKYSIAETPISWSDPGGVIAIVPYEQIEFKTLNNRVIGVRKKSNDNNAPFLTEIICDCDLIKDSNLKNVPDEYIIQNKRCRVYIVNGTIKVEKYGDASTPNRQSSEGCPRGIYSAGTIINERGFGEPFDSPSYNYCIDGMVRWEDVNCKGSRGFVSDREKCISIAKSKDGIEMKNAYKSCMEDQGWKLSWE